MQKVSLGHKTDLQIFQVILYKSLPSDSSLSETIIALTRPQTNWTYWKDHKSIGQLEDHIDKHVFVSSGINKIELHYHFGFNNKQTLRALVPDDLVSDDATYIVHCNTGK